ncbi:hypothetical protein DPSP01_012664 [Paraphaeosphaeria sporulosa]
MTFYTCAKNRAGVRAPCIVGDEDEAGLDWPSVGVGVALGLVTLRAFDLFVCWCCVRRRVRARARARARAREMKGDEQ